MDMEEELPTFRPFTREELATIENRIFENKLEAKKKQEQRDKNIAVRKIAIPIQLDFLPSILFQFSIQNSGLITDHIVQF